MGTLCAFSIYRSISRNRYINVVMYLYICLGNWHTAYINMFVSLSVENDQQLYIDEDMEMVKVQ